MTLKYTGDVKKYIADLEKLINHFPLRRESILIMATKPLGKEIQERVQLMDIQHGARLVSLLLSSSKQLEVFFR